VVCHAVRAAVGSALVTVLAVSGCSAGSSPDDGASKANEADVTFAQQMVPQQNQALQMADLATARAHSPQVRRLAATIANEDEPGMAMMQQWLTDSGQLPGPSHMESDGTWMRGDVMMSDMPAMLSNRRMHSLAVRSGAAFDRMFVSMMINHHRGAIRLSAAEVAQGSDERVVDLARRMEQHQRRQLQQMRQMFQRMDAASYQETEE